ncbi:Hsp20 family protein [Sphingobium sp. EP60837]|uniref:Hsp20 family protein n=1 Tax=Sphingobium sp. EP60837 TaxID=1855519 RepID=UPI0007DCEF9B|nr:Hsp20 family protein [Sphingobium sp. EP60837]ANI79423.1 Small heat shock protein HspA [Sphingobium sp. EP60837]
MRTNFDFTPFRMSTVGFDRLFDLLENGLAANVGEGYPPFNIIREGDDRYRIDLAVAGFRQEEIEISTQQNMLVVSGRKSDGEEGHVLYRGIGARDFERRFGLADHVQVRTADLKDGVLSIELMREIPEAMKPRKIRISSVTGDPEQPQARSAIANDDGIQLEAKQ